MSAPEHPKAPTQKYRTTLLAVLGLKTRRGIRNDAGGALIAKRLKP
jgi:hypothetical protein